MKRKWMNFSSMNGKNRRRRLTVKYNAEDAPDSEGISAADKLVLSSDFDTEGAATGSTRVLYRPKGAWYEEDSFGEKGYELLDMPEAGFVTEEGYPMLVREGIFVAIPQNAKYTGFRIINKYEQEMDGEYNILPSPKPALESEETEFIPNSDIYNSDDVFPANIIEYSGTEDVVGVKSAHLFINPIRYRPLSKKLTAIISLEFEVTYEFLEEENALDGGSANSVSPSPTDEDLRSTMILGYSAGGLDSGDSTKPRLLIVTTKELAAGVEEYQQLKLDEFAVDVVLTETIYAEYPDKPETEAVKTYLMTKHNENPLDYVMLAGDIGKIPSPHFIFKSGNKTYTAAYENYYCCKDEKSCIPLFCLSRIPAGNKDDLIKQLGVALNYPQYYSDVRKKVCLTTQTNCLGSNDFRNCMESVTTMIKDKFDVIKRFDGETTKSELTRTIIDGIGFLNYRGHGENTNWNAKITVSQDEVKRLSVGNNTPIVFSIACSTGAVHEVEECFAQTWMKNLKAVSFLAASAPSYRSENNNFDKYLWEAISVHGLSSVGEVFKWATFTLHKNFPISTAVHNIKCYIQFGDPTVSYWGRVRGDA